jgi:hypothetical protein
LPKAKAKPKKTAKRLPPLEAGEPVGEEEFKKIIAELDRLREENWQCKYKRTLP